MFRHSVRTLAVQRQIFRPLSGLTPHNADREPGAVIQIAGPRKLDAHPILTCLLKGIARTGGVIGIGYWATAVCGSDAAAIARAIGYTVNLVGVEHVGLGSDFDGAVAEPFDTTGLVQITDALIGQGFSEREIALIMGGNVIRLLNESLPE